MPAANSGTMIPCLAYRDARRAIEWLGRAFGFQPHAVYDGADGTVAHAELTLGGGMVMLGSMASEGPFAKLLVHPDQIAGKQTQAPYIIVDDADAIYASAKAAGAEILIDIKEESYGGRGFTCRDLEGYVWNFGTYDPRAAKR